jgi:hypothetical protein
MRVPLILFWGSIDFYANACLLSDEGSPKLRQLKQKQENIGGGYMVGGVRLTSHQSATLTLGAAKRLQRERCFLILQCWLFLSLLHPNLWAHCDTLFITTIVVELIMFLRRCRSVFIGNVTAPKRIEFI